MYLKGILIEAIERDFHFDVTKIHPKFYKGKIYVTSGQIDYESQHLKIEIGRRSDERLRALEFVTAIEPHTIFQEVAGDIESWEVIN